MIKEYVPADRRHNDFFENFMEQRNRKINNQSHLYGRNSSTPHTTFIYCLNCHSTQGVNNISSDSGIHSHQVCSPAMPITPPNQHSPLQTTSRLDILPLSPNQTSSPFEQFINNSRQQSSETQSITAQSSVPAVSSSHSHSPWLQTLIFSF